MGEVARAGRAGAGRPDRQVTQPTGVRDGRPDGHPTHISPREDAEVRRSIELENEAAVALAEEGYRVHQNPSPDRVAESRQAIGDIGNPGSRPDFLIEERVFDCYSPSANKPPRGIHSEVVDKVVLREQTQRVVLNLTDWRGDLTALRRQFDDWPIEGLKELMAITRDGSVVRIDLPAHG